MRILVVALEYGPGGGIETYTRHLVGALTGSGHEVEVWAALQSSPVDAGAVAVRPLMPRGRLGRSLQYRRLDRRVGAALRRQAEADLVVCMHPKLAIAAWEGLRGRIPYWVWSHGTDIWGPWSEKLRAALAAAERLPTVSRFTAQSIASRLPEAIVPVVYPGVDLTRFAGTKAPFDPAERPVLLTVSRITRDDTYKGHDVVIRGIPLMERALGRAVRYRIVGTGNGRARLENIARDARVADRVQFAGRVTDEALVREYAEADLFVMPSRNEPGPAGSVWGEGFGIAFIEAQAAGLPVVASTVAAAPETIRDGMTGLAVDPTSVEKVAGACARILARQDGGRAMGEDGRAFVAEHFSLEAFGRRIEELFA